MAQTNPVLGFLFFLFFLPDLSCCWVLIFNEPSKPRRSERLLGVHSAQMFVAHVDFFLFYFIWFFGYRIGSLLGLQVTIDGLVERG